MEGFFFESGHVYGATTFTGYISSIEKQATAYELLQKVNTARKSASVGSLKWDATLEQAAKARAREAAIYFSHTRPTGAVWYSASSKLNGENLYVGYLATATKANSSWMGSSGHRHNRLTGSYKSYGAAAFQSPDGYIYWVEEFSKSSSSSTSHEGANVSKSKVGVKLSDSYLKLKSYISTTDRKTISDTSLRVGGKYYMSLKNWNRGFSASYCQLAAGVFSTTNTGVLSINSGTGAIYCKKAGVTKVTGKVAAASGVTMSRIVVVRPERVSGLVLAPLSRGVSVAWSGIAGVKGYEGLPINNSHRNIFLCCYRGGRNNHLCEWRFDHG